MAWVEILTWLFLLANAGRIVAYVPQIVAAWSCPAGAKSVSILTWSYFAFAHLTALLYAAFVLHDFRSGWIFAGNLSFTVFLVVLLATKRLRHDATVLVAQSIDEGIFGSVKQEIFDSDRSPANDRLDATSAHKLGF